MKLCFIPPLNHLDLSLKGDMLFTLANLARHNREYAEFYAEQKMYKILDCGAAEGETQRSNVIMSLAREMDVNEIVIPDALNSGYKSTLMFKNFVNSLSESDKARFKFMIVPQGKTKKQFLLCLHNMLYHPNLPKDVIVGISKFSAPECFGSRVNAIFELRDMGLREKIHLLGTTNNLAEIQILNKDTLIRSNDSCVAILAAWKNQCIDATSLANTERPVTTNDYFKATLTSSQIRLAHNNIEAMKSASLGD